MNARRLVTELSISVVALLLSGIAVSAQTVGASIQGAITDANGSAVRNAAVEVRNVGTGVTYNAVTDAGGRYRVPLLPSGDYEIRVTASGLERAGHQTGDPRFAAQRAFVSTTRPAANRRGRGAGRGQRSGRRTHAEDFDQRRAPRAE